MAIQLFDRESSVIYGILRALFTCWFVVGGGWSYLRTPRSGGDNAVLSYGMDGEHIENIYAWLRYCTLVLNGFVGIWKENPPGKDVSY